MVRLYCLRDEDGNSYLAKHRSESGRKIAQSAHENESTKLGIHEKRHIDNNDSFGTIQ